LKYINMETDCQANEDGLWVCSSGDQMRIAGPDNAQFTYSEAYYRFTILI